jgi:hypothetical protein
MERMVGAPPDCFAQVSESVPARRSALLGVVVVLLTSRARRAVVVFPLLLLLLGSGILIGGALTWSRQQGYGAVIGGLLFAGLVLWAGLDELVLVSVEQGRLRAAGLWRRSSLEAGKCCLGIRCESGSRSVKYVVFASDGAGLVDLGTWGSERGAARGRERMATALFEPSHRPSAQAARDVAQIEDEWRAQQQRAKATIDAYYRSSTWKRLPYVIGIGLALYVVGMALYLYLTEQP